MMKPSRLFWKLFLAFWLATSLTFLVGLGLLVMGSPKPGDPHLETVLATEEQLLRQFGIESGRQLLTVWEHPDDQAIGVYDSAGQLLAGTPVPQPAYERSVISKEGIVLSLKSTHPWTKRRQRAEPLDAVDHRHSHECTVQRLHGVLPGMAAGLSSARHE